MVATEAGAIVKEECPDRVVCMLRSVSQSKVNRNSSLPILVNLNRNLGAAGGWDYFGLVSDLTQPLP